MRDKPTLIEDVEPFPDSIIESLPPRGDSYVSWPHYAQRLLLKHGGYEWEPSDPVHAIVRHVDKDGEIREYSVWAVKGVLTLEGERYGAVGEDDKPAAAESNAFKRACAKAGIGLHLYGHFWLHDRLQRDV